VNRADVLVEVVDASDAHATEHRTTVQAVLDELGAGDKPRLVAYNKADLVTTVAAGTSGNGVGEAPSVGGSVLVSALTGFGLDTLRVELSALLASLWVDVDVRLPYTEGELIARVRERGTIELDYRAKDVRVHGRVAPALAGELRGRAVDGRTDSGP
jgi:GTP-binding protein HflX